MKVQQHCRLSKLSSLYNARPVTFVASRNLHSSTPKTATPLPHPPAPGPPPKAPVPSTGPYEDRLSRKRKHAELLKIGEALKVNPNKPSQALQKRFWKQVSVNETQDGFQIMLDARPVRTPYRQVLLIPTSKPHLATAIALEWDLLATAQQALKQHYIPLTALTTRALDIQRHDEAEGDNEPRNVAVKTIMGYLNTDTLLCWAPENMDPNHRKYDAEGRSLRQVQADAAKPVVDFLTEKVWPGVEIKPGLDSNSIVPSPQPEMTANVIRGWVSGLPAFELAALERATLAGKSLLVGARLVVEWSQHFSKLWDGREERQRFTVDDAAKACTLEVAWQTSIWGEVEDTHDVEHKEIRKQFGSVVLLCS